MHRLSWLVQGLSKTERGLAIASISLMSVLPVAELAARHLGTSGIPGSAVFVQHLTLWVAFLGASLAASSDRLLSLSANTFLSERAAARVRVFSSGMAAAVALCLSWASVQFMLANRRGGEMLALGIPKWCAIAVMPAGLLLIAVRAVRGAGPRTSQRLVAALGLVVPVVLALVQQPESSALVWSGAAVILAAALLGLPIFATLGAIALLLFWNAGIPVAAVPVETYRLVASPVLPSLPLFTLAGYLLVAGGASTRLLRVYTAVFGWLPGGLAISTAVG